MSEKTGPTVNTVGDISMTSLIFLWNIWQLDTRWYSSRSQFLTLTHVTIAKNCLFQTFHAEDYESSILYYRDCKGTKGKQSHHTYRSYIVQRAVGAKVEVAGKIPIFGD